jgi:hypothetical protein
MILLQPLDHSDFGQAERTAAAEGETDAGTANRLRRAGLPVWLRNLFLIWRRILRQGQSAG